jgi:hypothetical protein
MRMEPHSIHTSSTDDPYPGIWLCPFPRLFFVNDDTGASYITQAGDVGGTFDAGGSIRNEAFCANGMPTTIWRFRTEG